MSAMENKKSAALLVRQPEALTSYLESLLREVPEGLVDQAEAMDVAAAQVARRSPGEAPPAHQHIGMGEGVGEKFQCLLFNVQGLTLAVPLVELSGISQWDGAITSLPGKPDWFLGLLNYRGRQAGIIDTALVVMPDLKIAYNNMPY